MRDKATEILAVLGLTTFKISLTWTDINQGLNALLTICTIVYVVKKIRGRKKK